MAEKITVARPYARAVFELAQAAAALSQWSKALAALTEIVAQPAIHELIGSPLAGPADRAAVINEIAGDALGEEARNLVRLLAENRRLELLPEIGADFEAMKAQAEGTIDVEMQSAAPVDTTQREKIRKALCKRLGREVHLHASVEQSLLGGAIIRAGDLVIDGSLKSKLERLASAMIQ